MLSNLINNACKYSENNGSIEIKAEVESEKTLILSVKDTGVGIAAEHLPRIFELFSLGRRGFAAARKTGSASASLWYAINVLVDVNIEYAEDAVAEPAQLNRAHLVVGAFHIGTVGAAIHFHHNMVLATEKVCEIVPDWRLAHEL